MGWVRSDARAQGQLTRLFARAIVLQRGKQQGRAGRPSTSEPSPTGSSPTPPSASPGAGSARATSSSPRPTPTARPPATSTTPPSTPSRRPSRPRPSSSSPPPPIRSSTPSWPTGSRRRSGAPTGTARRPVAGWGSTRLAGLTENRSIEAHLANHGLDPSGRRGQRRSRPARVVCTRSTPRSTCSASTSSCAAAGCRSGSGRRSPTTGPWSSRPSPTTTPTTTGRQRGSPRRAIRRLRGRPARPEVVNAYGNTDEGDMTAGIRHGGPAGASEVGRREARAMVRAWRARRPQPEPPAGARRALDPGMLLRTGRPRSGRSTSERWSGCRS